MRTDYKTASQTCPKCKQTFRTLADEAGSHSCPSCGYGEPTQFRCTLTSVVFASDLEEAREKFVNLLSTGDGEIECEEV